MFFTVLMRLVSGSSPGNKCDTMDRYVLIYIQTEEATSDILPNVSVGDRNTRPSIRGLTIGNSYDKLSCQLALLAHSGYNDLCKPDIFFLGADAEMSCHDTTISVKTFFFLSLKPGWTHSAGVSVFFF